MRGRILAKWSTTFSRSGPQPSILLYRFVTLAELGISVRIPHPAPIPSATRKHPAIIAPSLSMVFQDRNTDSSQTMNNTIRIQASVFIPSPLWKTISPTKTFSLCPKSHRSVYAHQFSGSRIVALQLLLLLGFFHHHRQHALRGKVRCRRILVRQSHHRVVRPED